MATPDALERAYDHARTWLAGLDQRSVAATTGYDQLLQRLGGPLPEQGQAPELVIDELVAHTEGGFTGSAGGRFYAWVIGGGLESAVAADWMTAVWDQNAAVLACSPAASAVEEVAGAWLKELLDLPRQASFGFVTGCQMAHATALAAARHRVLANRGWDVNDQGLFGAPPITVLSNDQRHATVDRALRFLGFGMKSALQLPTGELGQVDPDALQKAVKNLNGNPTILVLNAADLNIGAFDPYLKLIPLAKEAGVWVHVDGAFGLFARASRKYKHFTNGIELADSWAMDGHKWLNVPYDCGIAIVNDPEAHSAAMGITSAYVASSSGRDQIDWNPEWSRRARGFTIWAALKELGREGVEELIDRNCRLSQELVDGLAQIPGVQLLWRPTLNQGLVRFLNPNQTATEADHDTFTGQAIEAINQTGEAFFSGTTWNGMKAMRISLVNWRTNHQDIERAIAATQKVLNKKEGLQSITE